MFEKLKLAVEKITYLIQGFAHQGSTKYVFGTSQKMALRI